MAVFQLLALGLLTVGMVYAESAKPITLGGGSAASEQKEEVASPEPAGGGAPPIILGNGAPPVTLGGNAITNTQYGGAPPVTLGGGAPPVTLGGSASTNTQYGDANQPTSSGGISPAQSGGGEFAAGTSETGHNASPGLLGNVPFFPPPVFPVAPFEFNKLFEKYFQTLNANFQEWHKQVADAHQAAITKLNSALAGGYGTGGYGYPGGFPAYLNSIPGSAGSSDGTGVVGASATGVISPEGSLQTANLYPENANKPNVFAQTGPAAVNPGETKFYSVQTSSLAGSSDINGKKTSFRKAQTTVNDNGKVSTYNLGDP